MKKRMCSILLVALLAACAMPFAAAQELEPEFMFSVQNHLMDMNYGDEDTRSEIAVGDELWFYYQDSVPAELFVNGSKVHTFSAGEGNWYIQPVEQTGTLDAAVKQGDKTLFARSFRVISSADMYKQVLKGAFTPGYVLNPFLSVDELKDAANSGFPVGNPFLPFAYLMMMTVNFFSAVFSFTRVVR